MRKIFLYRKHLLKRPRFTVDLFGNSFARKAKVKVFQLPRDIKKWLFGENKNNWVREPLSQMMDYSWKQLATCDDLLTRLLIIDVSQHHCKPHKVDLTKNHTSPILFEILKSSYLSSLEHFEVKLRDQAIPGSPKSNFAVFRKHVFRRANNNWLWGFLLFFLMTSFNQDSTISHSINVPIGIFRCCENYPLLILIALLIHNKFLI